MKFSFIHAADLHLDTPFVGLTALPSVIREQLKDSTFAAYQRLIQLCLDKQVDFLVLSGDIYNSKERSLRAQLAFQQGLQRLSEAGISAYVIHGNHDPLDGYRARLRWPENAHFFSGEKVEAVPFFKQGKEVARIYGMSYATGQITDNLAANYVKEADSPYAIGILHTNVGGTVMHANYAPCSMEDLLISRMDYWALGHIHTRQVIKPDSPSIVYPGNIQGRSWKETGEKGCYYVEVNDEEQSKLTFYPLDLVRWYDLRIPLETPASEQELIDRLDEEVGAIVMDAEGRSVIARFHIEAHEQWNSVLSRQGLLEDLLHRYRQEGNPFAWLQRISIEYHSSQEEDPLLAEMRECLQELIQNPTSWDEFLHEAWSPLCYEHRLGSKWLSTLPKSSIPWEDELKSLLQLQSWKKGRIMD